MFSYLKKTFIFELILLWSCHQFHVIRNRYIFCFKVSITIYKPKFLLLCVKLVAQG